MATSPLALMGRQRGFEGAIEITIPITLMSGVWYGAFTILSAPSPGRGLATVELFLLLAVCVAVTAWTISRQMYLARRRDPRRLAVTSTVVALALTWGISTQVMSTFESSCAELEAEVVAITPLASVNADDAFAATLSPDAERACRVGGVPGNAYLVGTLLRPAWNAQLSIPLVVWLVFIAVLTSLGVRMKRTRPTQLSAYVMNLLRFAPAVGSASAMATPAPKNGKVDACANATLWGETCGQIYAVEKEWYDGEWCYRCQQPFKKSSRRFTFRVVTLFTGDVDVLNALERFDAVGWDRGAPINPDARISGRERWVELLTMDFPDVLTIAQVLALVHEQLGTLTGSEDVAVSVAAKNAVARASKISGWIWFGNLAERLTYARPNERAILGIGPMRLRDLIEDASEELWLQLDIGLLPLEIRTGYKTIPVERTGRILRENNKRDLWIPVSNPNPGKEFAGLWVPRIEGDALRTWLSTERLRDDQERGITQPLPYLRYGGRLAEVPEDHDKAPAPGQLDMVRYPMVEEEIVYGETDPPEKERIAEPARQRDIGASMTEWDWLEWQQIELLRQQVLVLEDSSRPSRPR